MAQVLRRIASMKITNRVRSNRSKEQETWKNTLINKERDKLLQEFLLAREELKAQFDLEKRELVGNYERRMRYLRRLLEDCDENINMLKLNLDAEKEENFILKTRIMELESRCNKETAETPKKDGVASYLNQSYDKDSTITSCTCSRSNSTRKTSFAFTVSEKSSIDGLKYSDRFASCGSLGQDSCFTSISTVSSIPSTVSDDGTDLHTNCRKEFNRLLEELRNKETKYNTQLEIEKENMREQVQNDKLQLERIVFRQLNVRLDRAVKKQELLFTENAHLRKTISNAIMERVQCQCRKIRTDSDDGQWKESNSDSGADVEDNRSDDGSDTSDSGKGSLTLSQGKLNHQQLSFSTSNELINTVVLNKLIEEPLHCAGGADDKTEEINTKLKLTINNLNSEIVSLVRENQKLKGKQQRDMKNDCVLEISNFSHELHGKLTQLEDLLMSDGKC